MLRHGLIGTSVACALLGACSKDKTKKADVSAELRSAGNVALNLQQRLVTLDDESITATIESYRVPISSIRLATGLNGSGYTNASPNFYSCPGTTDAECAVDITNASVLQNLLQGSGTNSVEVDSAKTYEGVAVEFCHEHPGADGGYFPIWLKASFALNGVTYYTNSASTISTTGPAEEIEIKSNYGGCGFTSPLLEPVTLAPDTPVTIVLYADPSGSAFGTTSLPSSNQSCAGANSIYACSDFVSIFGTVDTAAPTVERYKIDVPDRNDGIFTMMLNSAGKPFGASIKGIYAGPHEEPAIGFMNFNAITGDATSGYVISTSSGSTSYEFFPTFKREDHSATLNTEFEGTLSYTATKL